MKTRRISVGVVVGLLLLVSTANADLVDIADSTLPHFGDFTNQLPNASSDYSNISNELGVGDNFGWHNSPSDGSSLSGILFGYDSYQVTSLRLQVHVNPFKDFILQGSLDTTDGFDGSWDNLLTSTVTERTELAWVTWDFDNTDFYTAYRINALNDYSDEPLALGWAMHRWELLADDVTGGPVVTPEPISTVLFLIGGLPIAASLYRKRRRA